MPLSSERIGAPSPEALNAEVFCESHVERESQKDGIGQDEVQWANDESRIDRSRVLPVLRFPLRESHRLSGSQL